MTDMQVAVGLRWETGLYPTVILTCGQIVLNHLFYETDRLPFFILVDDRFLFHIS